MDPLRLVFKQTWLLQLASKIQQAWSCDPDAREDVLDAECRHVQNTVCPDNLCCLSKDVVWLKYGQKHLIGPFQGGVLRRGYILCVLYPNLHPDFMESGFCYW